MNAQTYRYIKCGRCLSGRHCRCWSFNMPSALENQIQTHTCMHSEMHTHMYKYSLKFLNQSVSLHMARPWMQQHWHHTAAFGISATRCPEYNCTGSMCRTGSQSVLTFTFFLFFLLAKPQSYLITLLNPPCIDQTVKLQGAIALSLDHYISTERGLTHDRHHGLGLNKLKLFSTHIKDDSVYHPSLDSQIEKSDYIYSM